MTETTVNARRMAATLGTPNDLGISASRDIGATLNTTLADIYALHHKTKNFHWHMSGPNFPECRRLFDEHASQILAAADPIAERTRKVGAGSLRSVAQIARLQRLLDNDADYVCPLDMLSELRDDNQQLAAFMREAHGVCEEHGDVATAGLLETLIDEAENRVWLLFETGRRVDAPGANPPENP